MDTISPDIADIVVVFDARFQAGTAHSLAREIEALRAAGLSIRYLPVGPEANAPLKPPLSTLVETGLLQPVGAEGARCRVLIAHNPMAFEAPLASGPPITADLRILVAHHAPVDGTGRSLVYDPVRVERILEARFGGPFHWAAISERCRASLLSSGCPIRLLDVLWLTVIDIGQWPGPRETPAHRTMVLGRHSRADPLKFPSPPDLMASFPESDDLRVRILGMPEELLRRIGTPPRNWELLAYGSTPVTEFLRSLDVFVYHHDETLFEAYGLVIVEAMAAGLPVIIDPTFADTFGHAPLYRTPDQVADTARALFRDPQTYAARSREGYRWVAERHAPEVTVSRYQDLLEALERGEIPAFRQLPLTPRGRAMRQRHRVKSALRRGAGLIRKLPLGDTLIAAVKRLLGR